MAMSINTGPVSPNHPYFFTAKLFSPRGALAGPMRILFLATKMCQPQCRDEERCAENHSSDHNSALETIQMPSFWEHTRLDVLHHDKASRDTEASHGRGTERPPRRQAALQGGLRPGRPAASPNSQRGFSPLYAELSTATTTAT